MKLTNLLDITSLIGQQKKNTQANRKVYDSMVDVSDVSEGYNYFKPFLFEKLIKIFNYENLPDTIPAQALEDIILHTGKAGIVNSQYGLVAVPINKYGVGLYPLFEPNAVYATPLVEGDGVIGKDIAVIKNNAYELNCKRIVNRYARMLADAESTIVNALYNARMPYLTAFSSDESAESYKAVQIANRLGQTDAVLDKSFLTNMQIYPNNNTLTSGSSINELITAREEILRLFLTEIGVATANNKRERLTVDEVNSNAQLLLFNIRDMYESRKEGVEEVNRLFGTNIKVSLAEEYDLISGSLDKTNEIEENKERADYEQNIS